ncbi:MAG: SHOCT domain-containing protein [Candidatus Micrarchaeota archaeon]
MRAPFLILVLLAGIAYATMSAEDFSRARQLVDSNASCDSLSDSQLELIGEYYMEQMHPGQAHEAMDRMMGGEGSESLKRQHIQMALVLHCGRTDTNVTYGGMMAMMPMFYAGGWMPGAGGWGPGAGGDMMGYGMMGYGYDMMGGYGWLAGLVFWVLLIIALLLVVVWLYRSVTGRSAGQSAAEILKQRFAKGEISKKEYEEMKKSLE